MVGRCKAVAACPAEPSLWKTNRCCPTTCLAGQAGDASDAALHWCCLVTQWQPAWAPPAPKQTAAHHGSQAHGQQILDSGGQHRSQHHAKRARACEPDGAHGGGCDQVSLEGRLRCGNQANVRSGLAGQPPRKRNRSMQRCSYVTTLHTCRCARCAEHRFPNLLFQHHLCRQTWEWCGL